VDGAGPMHDSARRPLVLGLVGDARLAFGDSGRSACGMEEHGNVHGIPLHVPRLSSGPSGVVCMLTYQPGNRSVSMFDLLTGHGRDDEEGMQRQSQFRNACGDTGWANQARKYLGSASSSGFFPARHSVQRSASIVCLIDLIPFPQHRYGERTNG
jgi:hypothetical protein